MVPLAREPAKVLPQDYRIVLHFLGTVVRQSMMQ